MASPDASLQSLFTRQGNPLHCFVPVCGERGQRGDNATACLLEVYLVLAPLPVTSLTPHMPPASLAVALVVVPRVGGMVYILGPCRPFKWLLLRDWKFLPPPQTPLVFTDRSYGDLSSWHWNPGRNAYFFLMFQICLLYTSDAADDYLEV